MTAATSDLYIEQGATFKLAFTWYADGDGTTPRDLTAATVRMQIRKNQQSPVLLDARSDGVNPKIIINGDGDSVGTVRITLSDSDTDALTSKSARYDIEVEMADGTVYRLFQGAVTVSPNITQLSGEPVVE